MAHLVCFVLGFRPAWVQDLLHINSRREFPCELLRGFPLFLLLSYLAFKIENPDPSHPLLSANASSVYV